jgi:hypothetical protein
MPALPRDTYDVPMRDLTFVYEAVEEAKSLLILSGKGATENQREVWGCLIGVRRGSKDWASSFVPPTVFHHRLRT